MVHPAAREFGIASLLVKVMMLYAIKESGAMRRTSSISPTSWMATAAHPRAVEAGSPRSDATE